MNIIEKNSGTKVDYTIEENKISFRQGEVTLDLSKYERDFPVHVDICRNQFDMLTFGLSEKYVAQIDIPAREYEMVENGADEEGNPRFEKVVVPFDISKVTLTLWSLEG